MSERNVRLAGAAGIVFVILILITVFAGGSMPKPDDPVDKIQKFYLDHRGGVLVSNFLGLVAIPFAVWFAVVLRESIRGTDRFTRACGTALLIGLAVTAPMAMVGGALQAVSVYVKGAAHDIDGNTLRVIFDAQTLAFTATAAGILTFAAASGVAIRRSRALPSYTMWLALLAVVGNFVTMFATLGAGAAGIGFAGVITFALFVLVTGITMAAGKVSPTAATP